jgi:hypothetical protein
MKKSYICVSINEWNEYQTKGILPKIWTPINNPHSAVIGHNMIITEISAELMETLLEGVRGGSESRKRLLLG